jgi:hypothetical protein
LLILLYISQRSREDRGTPRTLRDYKADERRVKKNTPLKQLASKSFPVWKWKSNSCAYDSALITIFFLVRSLPNAIIFRLLTDIPDQSSTLTRTTRAASRHPSAVRAEIFAQCERMGAVWAGGFDIVAELGAIRNEYRALAARLMGLSENDAQHSFVAIDDVLTNTLRAFVFSGTPDSHSISRNWIPRDLVKNKYASIQDRSSRKFVSADENIFFIQFHLRDTNGQRSKDIEVFESLEFPLVLHSKDAESNAGQFNLLACITASDSHFRTYIIFRADKSFYVQKKAVLAGVYSVDPFGSQHGTRIGGIPESSQEFRDHLPKFKGKYSPHILVYYRSQ